MAKKPNKIESRETESLPINKIIESNPIFIRRQMLGVGSLAGLAALTDIAPDANARTPQKRPRIAFLTTFWDPPKTHADAISTKLIDGYWWEGAHKESRVDVVAVYIHQLEASTGGQKVCKSKNIPIYKTVTEALTLGGKELAVDGVVIVGEQGTYPSDQKGRWLLPRWWIYNQVIRVFEQSKRSVPVFNDKHLSYNWNEARWMFDKSRELNFPLTGGSSMPIKYRKPEIEIDIDTPIKYSIVVGPAWDEGNIFHAIDVLQSFVERRKGGETGVRSVQSIRGPETWKWAERNPWALRLLDSVSKFFELKPGHFQKNSRPNVCVIDYNDGTKAAVINALGGEVGWTYAGEIEGRDEPTIISMSFDFGPRGQYHVSNSQPHWIIEMMMTGKEPFNAERLLLSTGITNHHMESNWEGGKYSDVGRRIKTPALNIKYRSTRGAQFSKGELPPPRPHIRGFES